MFNKVFEKEKQSRSKSTSLISKNYLEKIRTGKLEEIHLPFCGMGKWDLGTWDSFLEALLSTDAREITAFRIEGNEMTFEQTQSILEALPSFSSLRILDLSGNHAGVKQWQFLSKILRDFKNLRVLALPIADNTIYMESVLSSLGSVQSHSTLRCLRGEFRQKNDTFLELLSDVLER